MKRSRFTEAQIVSILKEWDAGMDASHLKRMKEIERELSQLKSMYADMALENRALKDFIEKSSKAA